MTYPNVNPGDELFAGLEHSRLFFCIAKSSATAPALVTLVTWEGGESEVWGEDQAAPYVLQPHAGNPPINKTPVAGYEWLVTPMLVRVKHDTRLWLAEDNGFLLTLANPDHVYDPNRSNWIATLREVSTGEYWAAILGSVPTPNKGMLEPFIVPYS